MPREFDILQLRCIAPSVRYAPDSIRATDGCEVALYPFESGVLTWGWSPEGHFLIYRFASARHATSDEASEVAFIVSLSDGSRRAVRLPRHTGAVAISCGAERIAVACSHTESLGEFGSRFETSADCTVSQIETGQVVLRLGHDDEILAAAFSEDALCFWGPSRHIHKLGPGDGTAVSRPERNPTTDPSGRVSARLVRSGSNDELQVLEIESNTGRLEILVSRPTAKPKVVCSPSGSFVAVAEGQRVRVLDAHSLELVAPMRGDLVGFTQKDELIVKAGPELCVMTGDARLLGRCTDVMWADPRGEFVIALRGEQRHVALTGSSLKASSEERIQQTLRWWDAYNVSAPYASPGKKSRVRGLYFPPVIEGDRRWYQRTHYGRFISALAVDEHTPRWSVGLSHGRIKAVLFADVCTPGGLVVCARDDIHPRPHAKFCHAVMFDESGRGSWQLPISREADAMAVSPDGSAMFIASRGHLNARFDLVSVNGLPVSP